MKRKKRKGISMNREGQRMANRETAEGLYYELSSTYPEDIDIIATALAAERKEAYKKGFEDGLKRR